MNVGIDLDNTIIDYEAAFIAAANSLGVFLPPLIRTKVQIREFLRLQANGEITWQRLQGLAYGHFASTHAKLYAGVKRFLWRCHQRGHRVTIVSHKTKHGHGDDTGVLLRQVAIDFLTSQGLMGAQRNLIHKVFFKATQREKIDHILSESFDWFIDDLPEVVNELGRIPGLGVVHFNSSENVFDSRIAENGLGKSFSEWQQIDGLINGVWTNVEILHLARELINQDAVKVEKYSTGGNSGVYRIDLPDQPAVKLKIYPIDPGHNRLLSEFTANQAMFDLSFNQVSRPLAYNIDLGAGVYSWIEGERVTIASHNDLEMCLNFLRLVHENRHSQQFHGVGPASAACVSGRDIAMQIERRVNQFGEPRVFDTELDVFFKEAFLPRFEILLEWSQANWPTDETFDTPLGRPQQTLSPSDFGFHNIIRRADGSLAFLDFEYFGWDDPVKLTCDFVLHQGMSLTHEQKVFWLEGALSIYGSKLVTRLKACYPLYGLIWCLILLNDFRSDVWQRRALANDAKDEIKLEILSRQIGRARDLLENIAVGHGGLLAEIYH